MFFAHAGAYHQVLDANTAYTKTEVDAALLLKADLTGATFTGPVAATEFQGNITGNLSGNVMNTDGVALLVDRANSNFNGKVTGNVTGNTVGNHYGSVYSSDINTLIVDGTTGNFVSDISFTGSCTFTQALTVDNTITATNSIYANDLGGTVWGDLGNAPTLPDQSPVTETSSAADIAAAISALQDYIDDLNVRLTTDQSSFTP